MELRLDKHLHIGACPLEILLLRIHLPCYKEAWAKSLIDEQLHGEGPQRMRPPRMFQPHLSGVALGAEKPPTEP